MLDEIKDNLEFLLKEINWKDFVYLLYEYGMIDDPNDFKYNKDSKAFENIKDIRDLFEMLEDIKQPHLVDFLQSSREQQRDTSKWCMKPEEKRALNSHLSHFVNHVPLDEIEQRIRHHLPHELKDIVYSHDIPKREKWFQFLRLLMYNGPTGFNLMLKALRECGRQRDIKILEAAANIFKDNIETSCIELRKKIAAEIP